MNALDLFPEVTERRHALRPSLISILTDQTCGEACWHAREEICRCSCGGKNHGCLKAGEGEQPIRTCKIAGERYELHAIGWHRELYKDAEAMNEKGFRSIDRRDPNYPYHYTWRETDEGAPARLKTAAPAAIENWPELRAYRDHPDFLNRRNAIYVLWRKIEQPPIYFCPVQCDRCEKMKGKGATA